MIRTTTTINTIDLLNFVKKEVNQTRLDLASGNCTNYDEYRYLVGYHNGLLKLESIINDLESLYLKDDED